MHLAKKIALILHLLCLPGPFYAFLEGFLLKSFEAYFKVFEEDYDAGDLLD